MIFHCCYSVCLQKFKHTGNSLLCFIQQLASNLIVFILHYDNELRNSYFFSFERNCPSSSKQQPTFFSLFPFALYIPLLYTCTKNHNQNYIINSKLIINYIYNYDLAHEKRNCCRKVPSALFKLKREKRYIHDHQVVEKTGLRSSSC